MIYAWVLRRWPVVLAAVIALSVAGYAAHRAHSYVWQNGYNAANVRAEKIIADMAKGEAAAQARARKAEQALARGVAQAEEDAGERNDQIERDYQRRIAGVVSERDRLRDLWQAERATDRLADSAAAAGASAEKDRLRRASAARIVRAVERAQSERDEVIDRYEAVRKTVNGEGE